MPGPGCHGITLHRGADRYPSHYLYSMESLDTKDTLSLEERREFLHLAASLAEKMRDSVSADELKRVKALCRSAMTRHDAVHDSHGLPKAIMALRAAHLFADSIDPDHNIIQAIVLYPLLEDEITDISTLRHQWGGGCGIAAGGAERRAEILQQEQCRQPGQLPRSHALAGR